MEILIFGAGWLGHKFKEYLNAELSSADITDKREVEAVLDSVNPKVVINTAGKTGKPNVDWCEDHKLETINSNITGPLILLKACLNRNILLVHLSSGCIFNGAPPSPEGFSEKDSSNPVNFYSWTKERADDILKEFPVLILRLRMPVDKEPNPRNLITKLANYPNVIDAENSITIVDDLLLATKKLIEKKRIGIYNIVNPGPVKHKDILSWYKEIVDPRHEYELISMKEFIYSGLVKASRSNCVLDTSKLQNEGIKLRSAKEGIIDCLRVYKSLL